MALLRIKNSESAIAPHKHTPAAGKDNNKPCCDEWMSYSNIVLSATAPTQVGLLTPVNPIGKLISFDLKRSC